ncbi:hypothetical protein K3495_g1839 [Podosphaera aphanis]|nr:hypothetical protein K3495_g1839 [Podosphaera aphanis]
MTVAQPEIKVLTEKYQQSQLELQNYVQSRQKLESQQQENKSVQKEFSQLKSDTKIYKLVGPILLQQEKTEAVLAVDARLEFIANEIKRVEKQIKGVQDQSDEIRMQIIRLKTEDLEQPNLA